MVSLQERAVALRTQTLNAILVMDYVNVRLCHRKLNADLVASSVTANSRWRKKYDLFIAIEVNCNLFNRARALASHIDAVCKNPMQRHTWATWCICLSIASPHTWSEQKRSKHEIIPLCTRVKQPNRMCSINYIANATKKYCGRRRRRSDRSQHSLHMLLFCIRFPIPLIIFVAVFFIFSPSPLMVKKRNSRSAM